MIHAENNQGNFIPPTKEEDGYCIHCYEKLIIKTSRSGKLYWSHPKGAECVDRAYLDFYYSPEEVLYRATCYWLNNDND